MRITKLILISFLFILLTNAGFAQDYLKIHFIDIGEGDAILIQAKNDSVLIDTGNLLSGYRLLDYLVKNKAQKIKYLIISHPHPDHISGAFFVLPKLEVEKIYDSGQILDDNDDVQRWYKTLVRENKNYSGLKKGDRLDLEGVVLEILWPMASEGVADNSGSLVIKLNYGDFSCLLMGDLDNPPEEKLLKEKLNLRANILKLGHHGYFDATSKKFLHRVSPEIAIISVDSLSKPNFPSAKILDSLKGANIKIFRTDKNGNIIVTVDEKGLYSVRTER